MLPDFFDDLSRLRSATGKWRASRTEYNCPVSYDRIPAADIRDGSVLQLSDFGAVLLRHHHGDRGLGSSDHGDSERLPPNEQKNATVDKEFGDAVDCNHRFSEGYPREKKD